MLYLVIETLAGKLSTEYIETEVFRSLSMKDTKFSTSEEFATDVPKSHLQDSQPRRPHKVSFAMTTSVQRSKDLYRWERALTKGAVISHDSVRRMFTPYRDGYGLGWKMIKEFGKRLALQTGRSDAFSVSVRLYPDDDDACIVLVAEGENVDAAELSRDIAAVLFGSRRPGSGKASSPVPAK